MRRGALEKGLFLIQEGWVADVTKLGEMMTTGAETAGSNQRGPFPSLGQVSGWPV